MLPEEQRELLARIQNGEDNQALTLSEYFYQYSGGEKSIWDKFYSYNKDGFDGQVCRIDQRQPDTIVEVSRLICIEAIKSYDQSQGKSLTNWIRLKWYYVFRDFRQFCRYWKHSPMLEQNIDGDLADFFSEIIGHMKSEQDRLILQYRLGVNSNSFYKYGELKKVLKDKHGIDIDRDDILLAERRFFRIARRWAFTKGIPEFLQSASCECNSECI